MGRLGDARWFRRTLVGASLVLAPLGALAALIVMPQPDGGSARALLAVSQADPVRWELGGWLTVLAGFLLVAPSVGAIHLLTEKGVALGHVGGGLTILGGFALAASGGLRLALGEAAAALPPDALEPGALRIADLLALLEWVTIAAAGAGLLLATLALWRAGFMPRPDAAAIVAGGLLLLLGGLKALEVAGLVVLAVGAAAFGVQILRMSDADWWRVLQQPGR